MPLLNRGRRRAGAWFAGLSGRRAAPTPPTIVAEAPVEAPPVEAPPVEAPPVEDPPVEDPPVEDPPVEDPLGRLDYAGADLVMWRESKWEGLRLKSCKKEPWTVVWLECSLAPGDVFLDVGANVGPYSLIAASVLRGNGRVVSIEPAYPSFGRLCENVAANGMGEVIWPLPVGLAERTGLDTLVFHDVCPGATQRTENGRESKLDVGPTVFTQRIASFALDDLVERFELPLPNLIKLDVDGTELEVLRGARRTLQAPGLRSLLVEMNDLDSSTEIVELLEGNGFDLTESHRRVKHGRLVDHWYGTFTRSAA